MNQILLNFGTSKEGAVVCNAIRSYAQDLDTTQKKLLLMALYEFMLNSGELEIAQAISVYQKYDGRRK